MATFEQVKAALLAVAGNPTVGVVADLVDEMARAVVALDKPVKEVRVTKPAETR